MGATILVSRAAPFDNWNGASSSVRRRAEKIGNATLRHCLLESHAALAQLAAGMSTLGFSSLSRRGDYFAAAVHPAAKIGIDIEMLVSENDLDEIAAIYFPPVLREIRMRLTESEKPHHFAACWSALEAVAKLYSLPLEEAGASLFSPALYQGWIDNRLILSVALEQETPLHISGPYEHSLHLSRTRLDQWSSHASHI